MCAFYGEPFVLVDAEELVELTKLADYYCALQTVSASILGAITLGNPNGCLADFWDDYEILFALYKLRHRQLFRDCVIVTAGDWDQCRYDGKLLSIHDQNRMLASLVERVRGQICIKIVAAHQEFLREKVHISYRKAVKRITVAVAAELPRYYRTMSDLAIEHTED